MKNSDRATDSVKDRRLPCALGKCLHVKEVRCDGPALAVLVVLVVGLVLSRRAPHGTLPRARRLGRGRNSRAPSQDRRHRGGFGDAAAARAQASTRARGARVRADSIGLEAEESFTTFSPLDRDTLVLVLSGAYRDRLMAYTWWFPIVGRVPYKGYFDFDRARSAQAQELDDRGFDVYLRPSPAFSTLGWFNDPLLSTSLHADTLDLANTVIHELTHNTFYASGSARLQRVVRELRRCARRSVVFPLAR